MYHVRGDANVHKISVKGWQVCYVINFFKKVVEVLMLYFVVN